MHYILFYEVVEDYINRRMEFRNEHLKLAWEACDRDDMVLGGALSDPDDGAVLLFKGNSPEVAESFAKNDPYVLNGLVKKWIVKEWRTVVGKESANPIKPE